MEYVKEIEVFISQLERKNYSSIDSTKSSNEEDTSDSQLTQLSFKSTVHVNNLKLWFKPQQ